MPVIALFHTLSWLQMLRLQHHRRRAVERLSRLLGVSRKQSKRIANHF